MQVVIPLQELKKRVLEFAKTRAPDIDVPNIWSKFKSTLWENVCKYKKTLLISILALPVSYVVDVWALGTLSAVIHDIALNHNHLIRGIHSKITQQEVHNAAWFFNNPIKVSWYWITKSSGELTYPGIRTLWLYLNTCIISASVFLYIRNKYLQWRYNKNDSRYVHGLKVVDNPAFGTTRWAGSKDIEHFCDMGPPQAKSGGVVLGSLSNKIVRVIPGKNTRKEEQGLTGHVVVYGVTGAGKSFTFVRNNIISAVEDNQSLVLTDPKGELLETMGNWLQSKGYEVKVFNLVNPACSHRWNPIMECRNDEEIAEMASCMIENAAKDSHGYFVNKEIQLLEAIAGLLKDGFPREYAHMRSALSLSSWTKEKLEQVFSGAFKEKRISPTIFERWRGASSSNLEEAKSGLTAKLKIITTRSLASLMSEHEIDLERIGQRKTALFCILPVKGSEVLKPILSVFYMFLFNRLYELAHKKGGRLPVDVRFILDEFANIGRVPGFLEKISTARSIGMLLQYILQGRSQLDEVYGFNGANTILSSTPIALLLGVAPNDRVTAEMFSRNLGEAAVYMKQYKKDISTPMQDLGLPTKTLIIGKRKLMEIYEVKEMSTKYCIADLQASKPIFMKKVAWIKLPQAKEIMACGIQPIDQYVHTRDLEIKLPEEEYFNNADNAGTNSAGSLLWGIKQNDTVGGETLESKVQDSSEGEFIQEQSNEGLAKTIVFIAKLPEVSEAKKTEEADTPQQAEENQNLKENADDAENQGFKVSSSIF